MNMSDQHQLSKPKIFPVLLLFLLLGSTWLVWSGYFKPLLLGLGLVSSVLCLWLALRMRLLDDKLTHLPVGLALLGYWVWLAREIVKSSISVCKIVLSPGLPISPRVARIRADSLHPVDQVILANSITLTPGTLSMDIDEGVITVHALTEEGMRDLLSGEMLRRISALRKK